MAFVYRNWKIEKGFYRIRKRRLKMIFKELGITDFKIFTEGMTIYGLGETIYKLTSLGERFLSRIHFLNTFSGYCYFGGTKI
jgi:hypothetical protein